MLVLAFLALLLLAMPLIAAYLVVDERLRRRRVWVALGGARTAVARQFEVARRQFADAAHAPAPARRFAASDLLQGIGRFAMFVPVIALLATYPFYTFVEWLLAVYPMVLCAWWLRLRRDRVRNAALLPCVAWIATCAAWFAAMPWWNRDELDGWWYGPLAQWEVLMPVVTAAAVVAAIAVVREYRGPALGSLASGAIALSMVASAVLVWSCLGHGVLYMVVAVVSVGFAMSRAVRLQDDRRIIAFELAQLARGRADAVDRPVHARFREARSSGIGARVGIAIGGGVGLLAGWVSWSYDLREFESLAVNLAVVAIALATMAAAGRGASGWFAAFAALLASSVTHFMSDAVGFVVAGFAVALVVFALGTPMFSMLRAVWIRWGAFVVSLLLLLIFAAAPDVSGDLPYGSAAVYAWVYFAVALACTAGLASQLFVRDSTHSEDSETVAARESGAVRSRRTIEA